LRTFTLTVWWAGNFVLGVLLYRGLRSRLAREYPVFYGYAAYVLCSSLFLLRLSLASRHTYSVGYWVVEFVSVLFGIGVTWEIYDSILMGYPGVRRMGRFFIALPVLVLFVRFVVELADQPLQVLLPTTLELERNLRLGLAALLIAILSLLAYYRISLGRNVASLLYGYTLFIATTVATLALRSALGAAFQPWWAVLQPLAYLVTLGMWCAGLWMRETNPLPSPELERDYERLSRQTIAGMARLRARLAYGVRS
jgi:hypothetical protein